jgi:multimeric flavodoxin WrbA
MTVLGISGSMRKEGNTARLVKAILERCRAEGIDTEYVSLSGKVIRPCIGCEKCRTENWCTNERDDWGDIARMMLDCEVLVMGSPTYYYDISGQLKNFIDRTYSLYHNRQLAGRKAVGVAVHASTGNTRALQTLEGFFNAHEFSYLGDVRGKGYLPGEVMDDAQALNRCEKIADTIIRLLRPSD